MRRGRRFAFVPVLVALAAVSGGACGELRRADATSDVAADDAAVADPDGGPTEGDPDAPPGVADAAEDAADDVAPPPQCDGPCPPEPLATGLVQATALAVDATNIYFAIESGSGTVYQCPKTGCVGAPLALGSGYATTIFVDATRVYWGDFSGGKLVACAIGGCANAPTTIAPNQTFIRGASSDGATYFWSTSANGGSIMRCAAGGACSPLEVTSGQGNVIHVAAEQTKVFWVNGGTKTVYTCVGSSCASPTALGPGTHDVSVSGGKAYWVNGTTKNVVVCAASGCAGNPLTIGSSNSPSHPVSDGVHVYWRDDFLDQIYECPAGGCLPSPKIIATKQRGQPGGQIALDGLYVYWTTTSGVYRLRK